MSIFIQPDELKRQLASSDAPVVIDVRGDDEFVAGHVPNALHIPLDRLEAELDTLPRDKPIVTYCMMRHPGSSRGEKAAALLQARGFDARVLDGGLPAWDQSQAQS